MGFIKTSKKCAFGSMSILLSIALLGSVSGVQFPNLSNLVSVYEVTPPLPDYGAPCASEILVSREFVNSYDTPSYVHYTPPPQCGHITNIVAEINLESYSLQYDRLIHLFKDGIEVWRPSSPEPVDRNISGYLAKDISRFANLFNSPGEVAFHFPNIVNKNVPGPYFANLTLKYYNAPDRQVLNDDSWFHDRTDPVTNFKAIVANLSTIYKTPASGKIPKLSLNTTRAVLNVYASGNSNEEFWYTNTVGNGGGTRLVEVYVNGKLAGAADPFPIIYTGGYDPALWSPLMGLRSTAVPSYIVDITPFLPVLWESSAPVEIAVGPGYGNPQDIKSNWYIDASLLTWETAGVTGSGTFLGATKNGGSNHSTATGYSSYSYSISTSADLKFTNSTGQTKSGSATWSQLVSLDSFVNNAGTDITQTGHGWSAIELDYDNGSKFYNRSHTYPLKFQFDAHTDRADRQYNINVTSSDGTFWLKQVQQAGYAAQYYSINDVYQQGYHRHAEAFNDVLKSDITTTN